MFRTPSEFLLHGDDRASLVQRALRALLDEYDRRWPQSVCPNLENLASTLNTRIEHVESLSRDASLVPVEGGFLILVRRGQEQARARTSLAHELVHTLFYTQEGGTPRRAVPHTAAEEQFCFDVSRRILAPPRALLRLGVSRETDVIDSFIRLRRELGLSRAVAARVMLQDYRLADGVAGSWERMDDRWRIRKGEGYASPNISPFERRELHDVARRWLQGIESVPSGLTLIGSPRSSANPFLVVLKDIPGGRTNVA